MKTNMKESHSSWCFALSFSLYFIFGGFEFTWKAVRCLNAFVFLSATTFLSGKRLQRALCAAYFTCLCRLCDVNVKPCLNRSDIWDKTKPKKKSNLKEKHKYFPSPSKPLSSGKNSLCILPRKKKKECKGKSKPNTFQMKERRQRLLCTFDERKQSAEVET